MGNKGPVIHWLFIISIQISFIGLFKNTFCQATRPPLDTWPPSGHSHLVIKPLKAILRSHGTATQIEKPRKFHISDSRASWHNSLYGLDKGQWVYPNSSNALTEVDKVYYDMIRSELDHPASVVVKKRIKHLPSNNQDSLRPLEIKEETILESRLRAKAKKAKQIHEGPKDKWTVPKFVYSLAKAEKEAKDYVMVLSVNNSSFQ